MTDHGVRSCGRRNRVIRGAATLLYLTYLVAGSGRALGVTKRIEPLWKVGRRGEHGPAQVDQTVRGANDYRPGVVPRQLPCIAALRSLVDHDGVRIRSSSGADFRAATVSVRGRRGIWNWPVLDVPRETLCSHSLAICEGTRSADNEAELARGVSVTQPRARPAGLRLCREWLASRLELGSIPRV